MSHRSPKVVPPPDTATNLTCLRNILDSLGSEPTGPIYKGTHKQLAEILLNCGDEQEALYHLCESHATTLRSQTCSLILRQLRRQNEDSTTLQSIIDRIGFDGVWHDGIGGLNKRLAELPTEWTVVQLTLEWDPLARFPPRNRDVNRGQGVHITRFSCGGLSENVLGEAGQPFSMLLPAFAEDEEQISLMAAMRMHLAKMDSLNRKDRRKIHDDCSLGIEATVGELQMWLGGWHCLFLGRLANDNLMRAIKAAVDSIVASCDISGLSAGDSDREKPDLTQAVNIFYLIVCSLSISPNEILKLCSYFVKDCKLANYLRKKLNDVRNTFSTALNIAKRHPVVLIIDEELDILPFEVISSLQKQPFTRMPSIHFLHAFHHLHKNSAVKNGIDTDICYYVINPSKNLPQLDSLFTSISSNPVVQKWKGAFQVTPSQEEILNGLQDNDMFMYCGHGGGNQYIPKSSIEKARIRAVVFLFGCSSSSMDQPGGRVELSSLAYSYLIAGSPSVVGMLWPVLDSDINVMTHELVSILCNTDKNDQKVAGDVDNMALEFRNMKIDAAQRNKQVSNLSEAVCLARNRAQRFLNRAAMVVRGLPLNVQCK